MDKTTNTRQPGLLGDWAVAMDELQREGRALALAVMWFLTLLIMATMAGMWYKIFWLGWVMAGGG